MKAPPGYARHLSERIGMADGAVDEQRVLRSYFVLFAAATLRKHKKWEHDGLLLAKSQGISMLRFELKKKCKDGSYMRVFDELVSAMDFTRDSVASLFEPGFQFCFADYDIQIVEEKGPTPTVEHGTNPAGAINWTPPELREFVPDIAREEPAAEVDSAMTVKREEPTAEVDSAMTVKREEPAANQHGQPDQPPAVEEGDECVILSAVEKERRQIPKTEE